MICASPGGLVLPSPEPPLPTTVPHNPAHAPFGAQAVAWPWVQKISTLCSRPLTPTGWECLTGQCQPCNMACLLAAPSSERLLCVPLPHRAVPPSSGFGCFSVQRALSTSLSPVLLAAVFRFLYLLEFEEIVELRTVEAARIVLGLVKHMSLCRGKGSSGGTQRQKGKCAMCLCASLW